jgi:hypothetical protein
MSFKPYTGSFDALTGSIFASWFVLGANGPMAHAVGYAELSDRPWSLFYRRICPSGSRAYVGAAIKEELSALSEDFGELFFNFLLGLNNYLVSTDEPFLPDAPAFICTNDNQQVDATMRWLVKTLPDFFDLDRGRERYLRQKYGAIPFGAAAEELDEAYERHTSQQARFNSKAEFARWSDLVTDLTYVKRSTVQFAQSWLSASRGHPRESNTISFSELCGFFDRFHLPLHASFDL